MEHRLLHNQRSRPLVVRRENATLTIWSIDFFTTGGVTPWWSGERMQL